MQVFASLGQQVLRVVLGVVVCFGGLVFVQAQTVTKKLAPLPAAVRSDVPTDEAVINFDTHVVSVLVSVTDKQGRTVGGLEQSAFAVFEDQVAQEINYFKQADAPASVTVLFDLSASMGEEKIQRARTALARFLQNCHPEDEFSLIGFNNEAWIALDRTYDAEQVLKQFDQVEPSGRTALYDAVALASRHLEQGRHARRVMLIITDGEDTRSRISFRNLKRLVQESAATVYAVGIGDFEIKDNEAHNTLEELTTPTGGKAFFPGNAEQMSEVFEKIALELRQQYSLGFTPTNFVADGKWRKLKVKVTPPAQTKGLIVRARLGYFAKAPQGSAQQTAQTERP